MQPSERAWLGDRFRVSASERSSCPSADYSYSSYEWIASNVVQPAGYEWIASNVVQPAGYKQALAENSSSAFWCAAAQVHRCVHTNVVFRGLNLNCSLGSSTVIWSFHKSQQTSGRSYRMIFCLISGFFRILFRAVFISRFSIFFPNIGLPSVADIIPSVKFPNFGNY